MTHWWSLIVWLGLLLVAPSASWADDINSHHSLTAKISGLTAIELKPGLNTVDFWGLQIRYSPDEHLKKSSNGQTNHDLSFHLLGMIFQTDVDTAYGPNQLFMVIAPWVTPFNTSSLPDTSRKGTRIFSDELGNYLIGTDSFNGQSEIQTVLFCNGTLDGHKQTFLIIATTQLIASSDGDAPGYWEAQPVRISIYGFLAGTPLNQTQYGSPPGFGSKIDEFLTTKLYCSSDDAIPLELPVKFSRNQMLENARTIKYFADPYVSSQGCP